MRLTQFQVMMAKFWCDKYGFKRKAEINIKYDEDLNLYFFVIKTTSELFSSDYDVLDTLDNVLSDYKYMGNL